MARKKNLLIINDEKDIKYLNSYKIKSFEVLTFSPNLYINLKKINIGFIVLKPNFFFNLKHHKLIIIKLKKINEKLKKDKSFDENEKIYLRYLFQITLSSAFFIWYSLGFNRNWHYINNKQLIKTQDKKEIFNFALNQLFNIYQHNFFGQISYFSNPIILRINHFINKINIFFIKKEFNFISNKKFIKLSPKYTLTLNKASNLYLLKNIFNLFRNFNSKNKFIEFSSHKRPNFSYKKNDLNIFFNKYLKIFYEDSIIIKNLSYCLSYNSISFETFRQLFSNSKIKNFFTDELKYRESLVLANYLNLYKKNTKIYLASHGTHPPLGGDEFANFQIKENSDGLLYSKFANFSVIQSKIAYDCIKSIKTKANIIKSNPVSWSTNPLSNRLNPIIKKDFYTILHASTFKTFCSRPYLYESPFEYIENLNYLISQLLNTKNIKLIIRPRNTPELNLSTLKHLIIKSDQVEISTENSFSYDLNRCNALISSSSTTIEEALYSKKPVLIYNCLGYNHFQFYDKNKSNPFLVLNKDIYTKSNIMKIESFLGKKNYNFKNYTWEKNKFKLI